MPARRHGEQATADGRSAARRPATRAARSVGAVEAAVLMPVKRFSAAKGRLSGLLDASPSAPSSPAGSPTGWSPPAGPLPTFVACDDDEVASWADERRRRGAVEPGARPQRRRRRRPGDDRRQGLRPPRDRPQRPAAGPRPRRRWPSPAPSRSCPTAAATAPTCSPCRSRVELPGRVRRRLVQPPPRGGDGRPACRVEVRRDPRLALDVDNPDDLTHPALVPHLPAWLRTILDNHR